MNIIFKLKIQENFIFQTGVANFLVCAGMEFREKMKILAQRLQIMRAEP